MKLIFKIALVVFAITVYSCNSASKKQTVDFAAKANLRTNNSSKQSGVNTEEPPVYTNLIFPKFKLKFYHISVYGFENGTKKSDFNGDSSEVTIDIDKNKIWTLTAKLNTVHLKAFYNQLTKGLVELIPADKNDKFKISYTSKIFAEEFVKEGKQNMIKTEVQPTYKLLKDSSNYFFIPESIYDGFINPNIDEVKEKLGLKDTSVRYKATDGKYYNADGLVSYKNKACRIVSIEPIYFKVERFKNGQLVETKYFAIEGENSEVAD